MDADRRRIVEQNDPQSHSGLLYQGRNIGVVLKTGGLDIRCVRRLLQIVLLGLFHYLESRFYRARLSTSGTRQRSV